MARQQIHRPGLPAIASPDHLMEGETLVVRRRSPGSGALRRLLRNRMALAGLVVIVCFGVLAIAAPWLAHDPMLRVVPNNTYRSPWWIGSSPQDNAGTTHHLLGTDAVGRDVLARVMFGARASLLVGVIPNLIVVGIGLLVGGTAGLVGGRVDNLLMRVTDVMFAFPDALFLVIMAVTLRDTALGRAMNGLLVVFLALSLTSWAGMARLIRGQVQVVKQQDYVEAARVIGCGRQRIFARHILPNMLGPILVALTLSIPGAIAAEAALGFLGLGLRPVSPGMTTPFPTSWGLLLQDGMGAINAQPWMLISSIAAIGLSSLAFTCVGDGLREVLDPRDRRQRPAPTS